MHHQRAVPPSITSIPPPPPKKNAPVCRETAVAAAAAGALLRRKLPGAGGSPQPPQQQARPARAPAGLLPRALHADGGDKLGPGEAAGGGLGGSLPGQRGGVGEAAAHGPLPGSAGPVLHLGCTLATARQHCTPSPLAAL
jgi:hypothetical protein